MMNTPRKMLLIALVVFAVGLAVPKNVHAVIPPPHVVVGGFRVQIRKDVPHRFGTCVRRPVSHFHVEVFKGLGGGRYQYLSNLHIGSYRNPKRCFVVWNNHRPYMCLKTCRPGQGNLQYLVRTAIFIMVGFFGITISVTVATLLARAISAPLYWALP